MSGGVIRYSNDGLSLQEVPAIKEITIEAKATSIKGVGEQNYAFFNAKDTIETVKFQENSCMASISLYCFYNCRQLSLVDFSTCTQLSKIDGYAFRYCNSLKTLTLPNTITSIGSYAFANSGLTSMNYPASVQTIGSYCLYQCYSLTDVSIHPDSTIKTFTDHQLTSTKITSFTLPKSVKSFSGNNLEKVFLLATLTVDTQNEVYESDDNVIFTKGKKTVVFVAPAKTGEYTIPETVTVIDNCAFHSSKITKVNFPSNLTSIVGWAFVDSSISELNLPETCKSLGQSAFRNCVNLQSIVFTDGLETIGIGCFESCKNLKSVILPKTIKTLGGAAFPPGLKLNFDKDADLDVNDENLIINKALTKLFQCASDKKVINLPKTIETIGDSSFRNIKTIDTLVIPPDSNLRTIENFAFYDSSLSQIEFPENLMTIGEFAFYQCKIQTININKALTKIGQKCFHKCKQLTTITSVNGTPLHLSSSVFHSCTELSNVDFNGRLISVGNNCFEQCTNLRELTFTEDIDSIGQYAFKNSGLTVCNFPSASDLTTLEVCLFYNCSGLTEITIPEGVKSIKDEAFAYTGIDNIILAKSVETLAEKCFQHCTNVQTLIIPESSNLTSIGFGSFYGCTSFKAVNNSCENFAIENFALFNKNKTELIILPPNSECKFFSFPESLQKVRISALQGCKNLQVIFVPYSVTEIMAYAFSECINLRSINIPITCSIVSEFAFYGCKKMQCGIAVENTDPTFRANLIEKARMPRRAIEDCDICTAVHNNKGNYILSLMTLSMLFISC